MCYKKVENSCRNLVVRGLLRMHYMVHTHQFFQIIEDSDDQGLDNRRSLTLFVGSYNRKK